MAQHTRTSTRTSPISPALASVVDDQFHRLLDTWNEHQALRASGASLDVLASSRARLDAERLSTHRTLATAA